MFSFFNSQRAFLVRQAVFLSDQIPAYVSDVEYSVMARAFDSIGDQLQADLYWQKCLRASANDFMKGINLRGYANYLFGQSEFEGARKRFQESINAVSDDSDRARHTRGETYLRWGNSERSSGFGNEADILFSRAQVAFESVGSKILKSHGLAILREARKVQTQPPQPQTPKLDA